MSVTHGNMNYTHTITTTILCKQADFGEFGRKVYFFYGNLVISHYYIRSEISVRVTRFRSAFVLHTVRRLKNSPFFSFRQVQY